MTEMVNHPDHYNKGLKLKGKSVEAIDIIDMFANMKGLTGDQSFLLGTVIKYLSRFPYKGNPVQDLKKADWYLQKLISAQDSNKHDNKERYKLNALCGLSVYHGRGLDVLPKGTTGTLTKADNGSYYVFSPDNYPIKYSITDAFFKYFTKI